MYHKTRLGTRHKLRGYARLARAAVLLIVGATLLAACGSTQPTSTQAPAKPRSITVVWQPAGASAFFYANRYDVWKKFGVKVNLIEAQSGPAMFADLASKSADVGIMGTTPFIGAVAKGVDLLAVAENNNTSTLSGLYVRPSANITSLADLKGKSVAVTLGSSADVGLHKALDQAGIPWSSVHVLNLAPAELLAAYEKGDVVGAWIWDTWGQKLLASGAHLLTTETKVGLNQPNIFAVRAPFAKAHPGTVARFVAALNYSASKVDGDPRSIAAYFAQVTGITTPQAMAILNAEHTLTIPNYLSKSVPISLTNDRIGLAHQLSVADGILVKEGEVAVVSNSVINAHVDPAPAEAALRIKAS